jgi:hypothetical protein
MIIRKKIIFFFSALLWLTCLNGYAQWFVDVETGAVLSGYNNVQIPRDTGTKFSLSKDLKTDPSFFYRLRLGYQFGSRHTLFLFVAPLSLNASGQVDKPINFFGEDFPANTPLDAVFRFDSYRLTYRYDIISKENLKLGIGLTAKIRDAAISVQDSSNKSEKTNVGFVPLINFRLEWLFSKKFSLLFEGDGAAASQGRAEDVLLALQLHLNENLTLKAGYRILEGGADVEETYNFTLLHFLTAGLTYRF